MSMRFGWNHNVFMPFDTVLLSMREKARFGFG